MQSAGSGDAAGAAAHDGRVDRRGPLKRRSAGNSGAAPGRDAAHRRLLSGDVQEGEGAIGKGPEAGAALRLGEPLTALPNSPVEILPLFSSRNSASGKFSSVREAMTSRGARSRA